MDPRVEDSLQQCPMYFRSSNPDIASPYLSKGMFIVSAKEDYTFDVMQLNLIYDYIFIL